MQDGEKIRVPTTFLAILILVAVVGLFIWWGNDNDDYNKAAAERPQNPGLEGVSEEYRYGIEAAANAKAGE